MGALPIHVRGDCQDPVFPLELPERLEEGDGVLTPLSHRCVMDTHQVIEQQQRVVSVSDLTVDIRHTVDGLNPVDDLPLETIHLLHARGDLEHEAPGEGAAAGRLGAARGGMQ